MAFHPHAKTLLAAGLRSGHVIVLDENLKEPLVDLEHGRPVNSICWSSDGKLIFALYVDMLLKVWDVRAKTVVVGFLMVLFLPFLNCYSTFPYISMISNYVMVFSNYSCLVMFIIAFIACFVDLIESFTLYFSISMAIGLILIAITSYQKMKIIERVLYACENNTFDFGNKKNYQLDINYFLMSYNYISNHQQVLEFLLEKYPNNFEIISVYTKFTFFFEDPKPAQEKALRLLLDCSSNSLANKCFTRFYKHIFSILNLSPEDQMRRAISISNTVYLEWTRVRFLVWNEIHSSQTNRALSLVQSAYNQHQYFNNVMAQFHYDTVHEDYKQLEKKLLAESPINFDDLILHVPTSTVYYKLDTIIEFLKCVYKMCNYNISECNCQLNTTHCVYSEIEKSLTMLYELNKPVDSPVPFDETVPF